MQTSEYKLAQEIVMGILDGEISKFSHLEEKIGPFAKKYRLAFFALFENVCGCPPYSLDTFFNILKMFPSLHTDDVATLREAYFYCMVLCVLSFKEGMQRERQKRLAKKLMDMLSPLPEMVIYSRAQVVSLFGQNWFPSRKRDSSKSVFMGFRSFMVGGEQMKSESQVLLKEFSSSLRFEFDEIEEKGYLLSKHVEDVADEYAYATGLLVLPAGWKLSPNMARKIQDRLIRHLSPSAGIDLVFYVEPEESRNGLRKLLSYTQAGIGVSLECPPVNHEKAPVEMMKSIKNKLFEKQIECLYQQIEQLGTSQKIEILKAVREMEVTDCFQIYRDGKEMAFGEESIDVSNVYIRSIRLIPEEEKFFLDLYKSLFAYSKGESITRD